MKIQQHLQLKPGYCPFTGKEIMKQEMRGGQMVDVKKDNYKEHWIQFETGERMKIGIDKSVKVTKAKAQQIVEAHIDYWKKGIEKDAGERIKMVEKTRDQNLDYYSKIKLHKHATKEKSL